MFRNEILTYSKLEDPNIIRFLGANTIEEPFFIAFEYLENGDLCKYLKKNVNNLR